MKLTNKSATALLEKPVSTLTKEEIQALIDFRIILGERFDKGTFSIAPTKVSGLMSKKSVQDISVLDNAIRFKLACTGLPILGFNSSLQDIELLAEPMVLRGDGKDLSLFEREQLAYKKVARKHPFYLWGIAFQKQYASLSESERLLQWLELYTEDPGPQTKPEEERHPETVKKVAAWKASREAWEQSMKEKYNVN